MMRALVLTSTAALSLGAASLAFGANPVVEMKTSEGTVKIELNQQKAPVSVENFLKYTNEGFYNGTVFHRVIKGFMVQGGGYAVDAGRLVKKDTKAPIKNEAKNGLTNDKGTLAMARTSDPDSATSQFFINHVDNPRLNYPQPDGHGYAVFGKVTEGMDVIEKIAVVETGNKGMMGDVPLKDVTIISMKVVGGMEEPIKKGDVAKKPAAPAKKTN